MITILLIMSGICLVFGLYFCQRYKNHMNENEHSIDQQSDGYLVNSIAFLASSVTLFLCAKCIFLYTAIINFI